MKIIKYLFLIAVLLFIGLAVFVSTQSAHFKISKSKIIKLPRTEVYNFVNDFKNWSNFISVNKTKYKVSIGQITSGKNATVTFNEFENITNYKTNSCFENSAIYQTKSINGLQTQITWIFKDTMGGTKVSLKNEGLVDFSTKVSSFFKGGIGKLIGNQLDLNLENLNKTLHYELDSFELKINGIVTQDSTLYVKRVIKCYEKDVQSNIAIIIPQLQKYFFKKNIQPSGKPFINYEKTIPETKIVQLSVCIPVKDSVFTSPNGVFQLGYLEKFSAFKGTLKGNTSHIFNLWKALKSEISKNKININKSGNYFVMYKISETDTKSQSNWITEIIIPLAKEKLNYIRVKRPTGDTTREPGDLIPTDVNLVPVIESTAK